MGYLQAKKYLDSFINYEIHLHKISASQFQIKRVTYLLKLLGNPEQHYRIVHVAGSKGKGSTSVMIATILDQAGLKVGLYTSPHLYDFKERIRVLKKPYCSHKKGELFCDMINNNEFVKLMNFLKPCVEQIHGERKYGKLTYFEMLTALALLYFKNKKADVVVLETGLGGRLDATNAVQSDVAVLTPISLEHTHILGKTIKQIAQEKAGIIKNLNQWVVIAPQVKQAADVFKKRCEEFYISPRQVNQKLQQVTNLLGEHQRVNAATARLAIDCLREKGYDISVSTVKRGLKNVFWPGRLEIIERHPRIILDGAHNQNSVERLIQSLKKLIGPKKVILIFGAAQDKDVNGMFNQLNKISNHIYLTQMNHLRSFKFNHQYPGIVMPNVVSAVKSALAQAKKHDVILATGSLYLVSEVRKLCIK